MHAVRTRLFESANASDLIPIFADVEAYPNFVPGYISAVIVERSGFEYKTKSVVALQVGVFTFEEEFDSVTTVKAPRRIDVVSTGKRFIKSLKNVWGFEDLPGGCNVTFEMTMDFVAARLMVWPLLASLAESQAEKILQAFVARVEAQLQVAERAAPSLLPSEGNRVTRDTPVPA